MNDSLERPVAVVGAGKLSSQVYRRGDNQGYRFSIVRSDVQGRVSNELDERDLRHLLNVCHVLAFAILDDGWIGADQRCELKQLLRKLDQLKESHATVSTSARPTSGSKFL